MLKKYDEEQIKELRVISLEKKVCIFSNFDFFYEIPLYQRSFAWEKDQLDQLIDDLIGFDSDKYFLGSLIVAKRKKEGAQNFLYEVVDGQQRLTALNLLLFAIKNNYKENMSPDYSEILNKINPLKYASRNKAQKTLLAIKNNKLQGLRKKNTDFGVYQGYSIITNKLIELTVEKSFCIEDIIRKLEKTVLFRINVPEETDFNRYFEVMNTRGVQLKQEDKVKATLMEMLDNEEKRIKFSIAWNACSDMSGYLQMHFDTHERKKIFGEDWNSINNLDSYFISNKQECSEKKQECSEKTKENIWAIVNKYIPQIDNTISKKNGDEDKGKRYESIVDFPHFLLHVLRVLYTDVQISLDDNYLDRTFNDTIKKICGEDKRKKNRFSEEFVKQLILTRFLFDKYIIKRKFKSEDTIGVWSLEKLCKDTQNSPYYVSTDFDENTGTNLNKRNLMIQSCLRVTYTSPQNMNWLTDLLKYLHDSHSKNSKLNELHKEAENFAKRAIKNSFLNKDTDSKKNNHQYSFGTKTPHIVFNYLDYLLFFSNKDFSVYDQNDTHADYPDFSFEFRNSVEHFYPQNPSEITTITKEDGLDDFGNLCIVSINVNSKFSNLEPIAKVEGFKNMIKNGSLKLRLMAKMILDKRLDAKGWMFSDGIDTENEPPYKVHEGEMLELLMNDCDCTNTDNYTS